MKHKYDSVGELSQELFEVKRGSVSGVVDFLNKSEDEFILGIETESAGSHEHISDVCSSLPGVGIEGEEGVELGDMFWRENWVFGGDVFGEDGLEFFFLNLLLGH